VKIKSRCKLVEIMLKTGKKLKCAEFMNTAEISEEYEELFFFFLLALQPPMGVVFYSPLVGFSLLAYEVS